MLHLVLLSGGSGSRLWPLSNNSRSKQFLKVLRDENNKHVSMVQRVLSQIRNTSIDLDITIATSEAQRESIERQIDGEFELVLEPERRDTAPAIMLACAHLAYKQNASREDAVVVMPIDTFASQEYYDSIPLLDDAVKTNVAELVLLGVEPAYPSEKYGYILPAKYQVDADINIQLVEQFVEKPKELLAEELISQGALWNCGVFAFKLGYVMNLLRSYCVADTFAEVRNSYANLPKISFDYEVVEKANSVAVISYSGDWKDLGTWNTLTEEMRDSVAGKAVIDDTTCENVHIINETSLPLVVAGLTDSVVVATPDGILVSSKEASAGIKSQVALAAEKRPMYEQRRWGEYRVIDSKVFSPDSKVLIKELVIQKGKQLSYQRHERRSEIWTVVKGHGQVVIDGVVQEVSVGSVVNIAAGKKHAVIATTELRIIEVQLGSVLIEEDIERFGNYWA